MPYPYVILALLVGCALRRNELAELDVETIQQREGRWVLADLEGKGRRIRTVAIPIWVKQGMGSGSNGAENLQKNKLGDGAEHQLIPALHSYR